MTTTPTPTARLSTRWTALAAAAWLAACAPLPPAEPAQGPATGLPAHFAQAEGRAAAALPADPWAALGDPQLAAWVERGLAANLDLRQAVERVRQARALAGQQAAAAWPRVDAAVGGEARQAAEAEAPGLSRRERRHDSVRAGLELAWEVDLFGRLARQTDAAQARAEAGAADAQALRLAIGAEVAQAWFALAGAREQREIVRAAVDNRRATLALVQRRAAAGQVAAFDEARARAELAAAEAELPALEAEIAVATHRLAVLVGASPSGFQVPAFEAPAPAALALAVPAPAEWLSARPDLRAAEARLRAQALDAEAVRAEFLPGLSIGGVVGFVAGSAAAIGSAGSAAWFVAPQLSLPLLDGGRLQARLEGAQARQREALLAYQQQLLRALEEVESGLARVRHGEHRLAALQQRAHQAGLAEALARKRHEAGASDLLELLDAQRSAQQAQRALSEAPTLQRQQVVALVRAFGVPARPAA